jgi:uncharacterized protein YjbI with pentapeptide repeats
MEMLQCGLLNKFTLGIKEEINITFGMELTMTREELLQRYASGDRDFSGAYLDEGTKLTGANLSGINLSGSTLAEAGLDTVNFSGANLQGAHFGQSTLFDTNLRSANLSKAILSHASLDRSDLTDCQLVGANLEAASLMNVNLTRANLTDALISEDTYLKGVLFSETIMPDGTIRDD